MSYILDALRRADAERLRGQVPGLHSPGPASVPPAVRASLALRAGAIGLVAGTMLVLGAVWLWRHGADRDATGQAALVATAPAVGTPNPAIIPSGSAVPPTAPAPTLPAPAPVATPSPPPRPTPPAVKAVAAAESARPRTVATRADSPAELPARNGEAPAPASAPPRLYRVDELPEEVRRQLPAVAIGGSAFSANPASRFVIVNGQLIHEGDTLAPGLTLEQIRLKSAVLAFKGYRYGISF